MFGPMSVRGTPWGGHGQGRTRFFRPVALFPAAAAAISFAPQFAAGLPPSGSAPREVASKSARRRTGRVVRGKVTRSKKRVRPYVWARRRVTATLVYRRGIVILKRIKVTRSAKPKRIRLFTGRFVARLFRGKRMINKVEFDFPLLGAAATFTKEGARIVRRMTAKMRTVTRVELPWDTQADSVVIFDKATRKRYALPLTALKSHPLCRPKKKKGKTLSNAGQKTRRAGKAKTRRAGKTKARRAGETKARRAGRAKK